MKNLTGFMRTSSGPNRRWSRQRNTNSLLIRSAMFAIAVVILCMAITQRAKRVGDIVLSKEPLRKKSRSHSRLTTASLGTTSASFIHIDKRIATRNLFGSNIDTAFDIVLGAAATASYFLTLFDRHQNLALLGKRAKEKQALQWHNEPMLWRRRS